MENSHNFFNKRLELKKKFLEKEGKSYAQHKNENKEIALDDIDALIGDVDPLASSIDTMYEYQQQDVRNISELRRAIEEATKSDDDKKLETVSNELSLLKQKEDLVERKRFLLKKQNIGSHLDDAQLINLDTAEDLITEKRQNLKEGQETATYARMAELSEYKREFNRGYIETPSRAKAKKQIADLLANGEHIFLEGDSGTGKTQLLRYLVRDMEGYKPDVVVSSDQVKLNELLGRDKLESQDGAPITVFKEGMLVRAMIEGKKIILDEFNNMDSNIRFALKPFYTLKPGDTFRLQQDGEKEFTVANGFGFLATGNLPSAKHPERKPLDPAETREFKMPHLDHMPKEETYDMLLAASMREDKSLPFDKEEAKDTLKLLTESIKDVHAAYEGNSQFYKNAEKKTPAVLQKAVLDPKEYLGWVSGYKNQTKLSLSEYLRDKISFFVSKGDFPNDDKNLLFKIFATRGFMDGVELKNLGIDAEEAGQFGWNSNFSPENREPKTRNLSLKEAAELDPFNQRKVKENEAIEDFIAQNQTAEAKEVIKNFKEKVGSLTQEQKETFTKELDQFWKDTFNSWGTDASRITFTPEWLKQGDINWKDLAEAPDDKKEFGKYITNPETAILDYESLGNPEIFDPNTDQDYQNWLKKENRKNTVNSVMDYVHETFKDTHYLPGIEYQKYLYENQDKIPDSLKDGNYHYFPGSAFRRSGGHWDVPSGVWRSDGWHRNGDWTGNDWHSLERVLLFGK